jgi:hypothetical protein
MPIEKISEKRLNQLIEAYDIGEGPEEEILAVLLELKQLRVEKVAYKALIEANSK